MSPKNENIRLLESVLGDELDLLKLIDGMPHMFWIATAREGFIFASRRWEEFTGLPIEKMLGDQWPNLIHPDDRDRVLQEWQRATTTSSEFKVECRVLGRGDSYRWFDNRAVPLHNDKGHAVKWLGTLADIHEIYRARDALTENEERLRYVELATRDAIYDWDMRTGVTRRNEAFRTLFGAPEFAQNKERWWELHIHPEDRKRVVDSAAAAFRARLPTWDDEYRFLRPDGSYASVVDRGYLLYDSNRKPLRMIGAISDISARKQVEQSLRDAQARLLTALEGAAMATWIWEIEPDRIFWDDAAYRLWGRTREELPSLSIKGLMNYVEPEDLPAVQETIAEFYRTGVADIIELRPIRSDGALQWLQIRSRVERDANGRAIRMVGVYIDITDRKRVEGARLLSQKMEALGTLAGGIAHDFNNILLAISGNAKLALDDLRLADVDPTSVRRNLLEIEKASTRAADLVRRILTFSRQQEGQRDVIQLQPAIEEALRLLRPSLPTNVKIRASYAENTDPVSTDAIQIQQVVMNLVTNAAHAIGTHAGVIEIDLSACNVASATGDLQDLTPGRYVILSVRDNGAGIEKAIVDRIFDPFFTTKQAGEGTGLGLAVVHGIVKAHGGAIELQSEVGHGTQFRVFLPAAAGEVSRGAAPVVEQKRGAGEHVLYVDDEESLVFLITRVLERMGYRVTGFIDPQQALDAFAAQPKDFDVVVTDLSMRGLNGFELARAVRKMRPNIPILLTSGYLRNEDREMAQQCGIREMILKPNTVEELGLAIDRELSALRA